MTAAALREPPLKVGQDSYSARHLTVLEGQGSAQAARHVHRSTDGRGRCTACGCRQLGGRGPGLYRIEIVLHADHSAEVRDNGRGIPVDIEPKTGLNGVELVHTRLHAGGKFGGGSYTASGGLHGVGASVVNALSGRLDVHVDREGYEWAVSFRGGVPGEFSGPGPDAGFTPGSGCAGARRPPRHGLAPDQVLPDRHIFVRDAEPDSA